MLVTIAGPPEARPADGLAVDFVVQADRAQVRNVAPPIAPPQLHPQRSSFAMTDRPTPAARIRRA